MKMRKTLGRSFVILVMSFLVLPAMALANAQFYTASGQHLGSVNFTTFWNAQGTYLGHASGDSYYTSHGQYFGYSVNDQLYNTSHQLLGYIQNNWIYSYRKGAMGYFQGVDQDDELEYRDNNAIPAAAIYFFFQG